MLTVNGQVNVAKPHLFLRFLNPNLVIVIFL